MRNYRSNVAFIDLLFNLLVGFTSLFIIALLLINPVAKTGKIEPEVELIITTEWDKDSNNDFDIWVKGPNGPAVGYSRKDIGYIVLNRDDIGINNDSYFSNGKRIILRDNREAVEIRGIVPGEYIVNLHFYRLDEKTTKVSYSEPVIVQLLDIRPFTVAIDEIVVLPGELAEITAFTFRVDADGNIYGIKVRPNTIRIASPSVDYYEE